MIRLCGAEEPRLIPAYQIGFTFLVPAHPGSPGQRAVKRVCVCMYMLSQVRRSPTAIALGRAQSQRDLAPSGQRVSSRPARRPAEPQRQRHWSAGGRCVQQGVVRHRRPVVEPADDTRRRRLQVHQRSARSRQPHRAGKTFLFSKSFPLQPFLSFFRTSTCIPHTVYCYFSSYPFFTF